MQDLIAGFHYILVRRPGVSMLHRSELRKFIWMTREKLSKKCGYCCKIID